MRARSKHSTHAMAGAAQELDGERLRLTQWQSSISGSAGADASAANNAAGEPGGDESDYEDDEGFEAAAPVAGGKQPGGSAGQRDGQAPDQGGGTAAAGCERGEGEEPAARDHPDYHGRGWWPGSGGGAGGGGRHGEQPEGSEAKGSPRSSGSAGSEVVADNEALASSEDGAPDDASSGACGPQQAPAALPARGSLPPVKVRRRMPAATLRHRALPCALIS